MWFKLPKEHSKTVLGVGKYGGAALNVTLSAELAEWMNNNEITKFHYYDDEFSIFEGFQVMIGFETEEAALLWKMSPYYAG